MDCENTLDTQTTIFDYIEDPGRTGHRRRLSSYRPSEDGHFLSRSRSMATTPSTSALLRHRRIQSTLSLMQDALYEKVSLEPHFEYSENAFSVGFKIGTGTRYVLKDVFAFTWHMESCSEYSYGKKLAFVHTVNTFEPLSQKIAAFILNWV